MSVRINLEIGHEASIRTKRTPEGFTHDWEVFVRGCDGAEIHCFVEKVVFNLHETFPKPRRVIKEPPYSVKESGYAGFNLPIEIYLRNKDEPKKVKFNYDLHLQQSGPAIIKVQKEKYVFNSPGEEFKHKLLKGGGIIVSPSSLQDNLETSRASEAKNELINKPKLGGSEPVKKHKMKVDEPRIPNSFQDLFGPPITKTTKTFSESKPVSKDNNKNSSSKSEKVSEKEKTKEKSKYSPAKEKDKEKERDKPKEKIDSDRKKDDRRSKEHSRERGHSKEKSAKREKSPKPRSPSPKRMSSPKRPPSPPPIKHKDEKRLDSGKEKEKKDRLSDEKKTKKEKRDKEKDHKENKHKDKDSQKPSECKEHKKEQKFNKEAVKETEMSPSVQKNDRKERSKEKDSPKELSKDFKDVKEPEVPLEKNVDKVKTDKVEEKQKHKHKKKDKDRKDKDKEKSHKEKSKEKDKQLIAKHPEVPKEVRDEKNSLFSSPKNDEKPKKPISTLFSEPENDSSNSSMSSRAESFAEAPDKTDSKKESLFEPKKLKSEPEKVKPKKEKAKKNKEKRTEKEEKKRKRKSDKIEDEPVEKIPKEEVQKIESSDSEQNSNAGQPVEVDKETQENPEDYMQILRDLQHKIMTLQDNSELQKVVQLIAETGRYEVSARTFDFDLCLLEKSTVRQLQEFFASSS